MVGISAAYAAGINDLIELIRVLSATEWSIFAGSEPGGGRGFLIRSVVADAVIGVHGSRIDKCGQNVVGALVMFGCVRHALGGGIHEPARLRCFVL